MPMLTPTQVRWLDRGRALGDALARARDCLRRLAWRARARLHAATHVRRLPHGH